MPIQKTNPQGGTRRFRFPLLTAPFGRRGHRPGRQGKSDRDLTAVSPLEFPTRITSRDDALDVLEQILRAAIHQTGSSGGYIMLTDAEHTHLHTEVAIGIGNACDFPALRAFGDGLEGNAASSGRILAANRNGKGGPHTSSDWPPPAQAESALCIPLLNRAPEDEVETLEGVLTLVRQSKNSAFTDAEIRLSNYLASQAAQTIVSGRLFEAQHGAFIASLQTLAFTLEARDRYQQGHSFRVSELCVMIAQSLRVAPEIVAELRKGALLHDVGKVGVSETILYNPGRLTEEEFALMKQHPVLGYDLCKPLGLHPRILMLIRNHHERLDGTGYPDGLRLNEIPLPLRIICVADAFDAMSSLRPYRQAIDSRMRNEQLNRFAGTQFDPIVIEKLKAIMLAGDLDELYKDHWIQEDTSVLPTLLQAA